MHGLVGWFSMLLLTIGLLASAAWAPVFAQVTIKIGHTDNPSAFDSPGHGMCVIFKDVVERETRGQIKVNIFPSSQLGKEREILEAVKMGIVEATNISEGGTVTVFPTMEVLGIPFLYPTLNVAYKVMDGPFGDEFKAAMLRETGIRVIGTAAPGPFRNFGAKKPLRNLEDLKGLRIRTMEHPVHQALVKALGASPTPIPFGEVYTAMKSGVIDGIELPYQATLNMKLDEVVKYMIADGHVFNQMFLLVSEKWFRALSADHQKAILKAGKEAQEVGRSIVRMWEAAGAEELRMKGVQIYFPTAQELKVFRDTAQPPVLTVLQQRVDKKWIDGLLKAVEVASKE